MEKIKEYKNHFLAILLLVLLVGSAYQTYALADLMTQLNEGGISFGKAQTGYSFGTDSKSLSELPDMAGGC